jgi:hypothetical protein
MRGDVPQVVDILPHILAQRQIRYISAPHAFVLPARLSYNKH